MTLSAAWVRSTGDVSELVFASDSRLSGGMKWDSCPKIIALPRSDCMISFAGDTAYAYPLVLQIINGISFYPRSRDRHMDITHARHVAIDVFNSMRSEIKDHYLGVNGPGDPGTQFIFGGYSWQEQAFKIWTLHYDSSIDRFTFRPAARWRGQNGPQPSSKLIAWIGDEPAVDAAKDLLGSYLRNEGKTESGGFNMEPFKVLRDIIRGNQFSSVGGAPQVAKVYRSLQTQHFAVRWPNANGAAYASGRRELEYEDFGLPEIKPDSPELHSFTSRIRYANKGSDTAVAAEDQK